VAKLQGSLLREAVLGFQAGVFISLGFATCMIAAGQVGFQQLDVLCMY
jgi:formate/nitrite transporter FocA (FNT family)